MSEISPTQAMIRRIQIDNGGAPPRPVSESVLGWGIHGGFGWRFNKRRTAIGGSFFYGQGIGRYTTAFRDAIADIIDCWSRGTLTTGSILTGQGD